jgi:hypothetical protein
VTLLFPLFRYYSSSRFPFFRFEAAVAAEYSDKGKTVTGETNGNGLDDNEPDDDMSMDREKQLSSNVSIIQIF